jgi:hypothetical protein
VRQKLIGLQSLGSKDRPNDQIGAGQAKKGLVDLGEIEGIRKLQ